MAMIFQSYALWPHMTVAQNVGYGLRFKPSTGAGRARPAGGARCCASVQLAGYEARYPGELSGGQQQRVAVARALVVEPEILLLDEPLSNLDANLREEMRFEIRRLHEAFGITTLYVTHDQAEAMVISDRIAVLERGRVAQVGTADELFRAPAHALRRRVHRPDEPGRRRGAEPGRRRARRGCDCASPRPTLEAGPRVAVSIRPHDIALVPGDAPARGPAAGWRNVLRGTVQRASFLGDGVDYQVDVADVTLRVAAPAASASRPGRPSISSCPSAIVSRCRNGVRLTRPS